jgi:hypothetical protein
MAITEFVSHSFQLIKKPHRLCVTSFNIFIVLGLLLVVDTAAP